MLSEKKESDRSDREGSDVRLIRLLEVRVAQVGKIEKSRGGLNGAGNKCVSSNHSSFFGFFWNTDKVYQGWTLTIPFCL